MEIQVRTDRALAAGPELASFVGYEIVAGLGACTARVVSAFVELTQDTSSVRRPGVLCCQLEVRPHGHAPVVVSRFAGDGDAAVRGAVADMRHLLERMFRRIDGLAVRI